MRATAIDAALAAANPVQPGVLSSAGLQDAGAEMLAAIIAEPHVAPSTPGLTHGQDRRVTSRTKLWHRTRWLTACATATAVAAVLVVTLAGSGGPDTGTPAFGAVLIRYAENSPLLMLQLRGWQTVDAIEDSPDEGELHYLPEGAPRWAPEAELHWRTGRLSGWVKDRAASSDLSIAATVLGARARVFRYIGNTRSASTFTALWLYNGRVLEYRATVLDLAAFEQMLAAIHAVDEKTWLSALPPSVITAAEHPSTVTAMLEGIPLPPGFAASQISKGGLAQDRYQVGAAVAGTVACEWIRRWMEGRRSGNGGEVQEAIAAMATAPHWPVLRSMESQGAYPQVLDQYASEMAAGSRHGYPLGAAADAGLGCASRGVTLPLDKAERSYGPQPLRASP